MKNSYAIFGAETSTVHYKSTKIDPASLQAIIQAAEAKKLMMSGHQIPTEALKGFPGPDILIGDHLRVRYYHAKLRHLQCYLLDRILL